jgi:hypothetical protein
LKAQKATHARLVICPIHTAQVSFTIRHDQHLADGRIDSVNQQLQDLAHGVPGIRDHSGIQPTKKKVAMIISLPKTAPGGLASLNLKR